MTLEQQVINWLNIIYQNSSLKPTKELFDNEVYDICNEINIRFHGEFDKWYQYTKEMSDKYV